MVRHGVAGKAKGAILYGIPMEIREQDGGHFCTSGW